MLNFGVIVESKNEKNRDNKGRTVALLSPKIDKFTKDIAPFTCEKIIV